MTPAGHIERAERLLESAAGGDPTWETEHYVAVALDAVAHALIAIAVELGAPHMSGDTTAASSG